MLKRRIHVNVPFVANRLNYIVWTVINVFAFALLCGGGLYLAIMILGHP